MHVDDDIICFPKEGWTFVVFGSEDDLNFMIAKSCVTCMGADSSWVAPFNLYDLKI